MTNLTGANMNLTTQVTEYANHMATKDSAMAKMQKMTSQIQGETKNLKGKLAGHTTKRPDAKKCNKGKWWSNTY